jgi:hypothetical protein
MKTSTFVIALIAYTAVCIGGTWYGVTEHWKNKIANARPDTTTTTTPVSTPDPGPVTVTPNPVQADVDSVGLSPSARTLIDSLVAAARQDAELIRRLYMQKRGHQEFTLTGKDSVTKIFGQQDVLYMPVENAFMTFMKVDSLTTPERIREITKQVLVEETDWEVTTYISIAALIIGFLLGVFV